MPLTTDTVAAMTKPELETLRGAHLRALAGNLTATKRAAIQAELSLVNGQIKHLNIEQARQLKADADRRRAEGLAIHQASTARAIAKLVETTAPREEIPSFPPEAKTLLIAPPPAPRSYPKGVQTLGEFILMRAEQLRSALRRPREPMPHSTAFLAQLEGFLEVQRMIVEAEKRERKAAEKAHKTATASPPPTAPADWKETWKDSK